jgi:PilZ domain
VASKGGREQGQELWYARSSSRLNSRVPVALEWSEGGEVRRTEGRTLDISPKGCLAIFPQRFTVGQQLRIRNLVNQKTDDAVLVWRGHEGRGGWELGIELVEPPLDFWEVDL